MRASSLEKRCVFCQAVRVAAQTYLAGGIPRPPPHILCRGVAVSPIPVQPRRGHGRTYVHDSTASPSSPDLPDLGSGSPSSLSVSPFPTVNLFIVSRPQSSLVHLYCYFPMHSYHIYLIPTRSMPHSSSYNMHIFTPLHSSVSCP